MKQLQALMLDISDFESSTHDARELYVNDLIDPELVSELKVYNERYEELNEEELRDMINIQSFLLNQLGIYGEDKQKLVTLIPKEQRKDPSKGEKVKSVNS